MTHEQALKILELNGDPTELEITAAKRRILQALHPDHHPIEQGAIFSRLTQDVIAAATFLESQLGRPNKSTARTKKINEDDEGILTTLFDEDEASEAFKNLASSRRSIIRFGQSYATDGKLAIGVRGIDHEFNWTTTTPDGRQTDKAGSALYVIVKNRTKKHIESFNLGNMSYLIDDREHQYAPKDICFYWCNEDGAFNIHSDFLAPRSKIDGFILFPSLRSTSNRFKRYVINGHFQIGPSIDEYKPRYYDVKLKRDRTER